MMRHTNILVLIRVMIVKGKRQRRVHDLLRMKRKHQVRLRLFLKMRWRITL